MAYSSVCCLVLLASLGLASSEPLAAFAVKADRAWRVWSDRLSLANEDFICYEPMQPADGWVVLGQRGQRDHKGLAGELLVFKSITSTAVKKAESFSFIWDTRSKAGLYHGSLWRATCPNDYVALGDFFFHESKIAQPDDAFVDRIRCVHKDLVETCLSGPRIWSNEGSLLSAVSVWSTAPESTALGGFFYGNGIHDQRPGITFWCLKNSSFQVINRA